MTDEDITKLASKLTDSLATKKDLQKLENKMDELKDKVDTILEFTEGLDETATDHEKRLKKIDSIPVIAHQIKK